MLRAQNVLTECKIKSNYRKVRMLVGLALMDTSLPQNAILKERIKREAQEFGLFETYLESAPQFILQCSIILITGNTSNCYLFQHYVLVLTKLIGLHL